MSGSDTNIMGVSSKVVFWTVFVTVLIPSIWFIVSSYSGLQKILTNLYSAQSLQTIEYFKNNEIDTSSNLALLAHLEYDTFSNRQGRSISFIATRTWLRFMSSGFGSILIFVGSIFLLCRIESSNFNMNAESGSVKASVVASSPGIAMLFVGAVLMLSPTIVDQPIETNDGSSYIFTSHENTINAAAKNAADTPEARKFLENLSKE